MPPSQKVQTHDPVCGMNVQDGPDAIAWEYQGVRYLFCAEGCREEFQAHPDQFIKIPTKPRSSRLGKELMIAVVLFLIALAVVLTFRSIRKATSFRERLDDIASTSVVQTERGAL